MPVRKIALPDDGVETFFGTHDENLRHLETLFGVEIRTDGHGLLVEGDGAGAERVDRFVGQVAGLMKDGYKFAPGEVKTAASLIAEDPAVDIMAGAPSLVDEKQLRELHIRLRNPQAHGQAV